MFDITSLIREKIFRLPKIQSKTIAWEELSEKQTTKLGYFLLYCMFGTILMSAQWTLSIINKIPTRPTQVPTCVGNLISVMQSWDNYYYSDSKNSYSYDEYNSCELISEVPKYNFTNSFNSLDLVGKQINIYGDKIRDLENDKTQAKYDKSNAQNDYNTALVEKIAGEENKAYNTNDSRNTIKDSRTNIVEIDNKITAIKASIELLRSTNIVAKEALQKELDMAEIAYKNAYLMYRFIVAILSLIFSVIVFSILYRLYVQQKLKNSPHTIIFSIATFAYGLVFLEVVGLFLWDIIPHKIFALLLNLLSVFTPLLYIVQFLWPILIIVVFGYLVFRIQKRLYSPENILKRFISDKKCPNCGNGVDFTKPYCPLCSHEIQLDCPHCHALTLKWMPYCSSCGNKLSK